MTTFTRTQLFALWKIARGLTYPWATSLTESELIFSEATKSPSTGEREEHNARFWNGESSWTDERIKQETLARNTGINPEIDRDLAPSPTFTYSSRRGHKDVSVTVNVSGIGEITVDVGGKIVFRADSWLAASTFLNWDWMTSTPLPGWTLLKPQRHLLTNGDVALMFADDATGAELAELGRALSGFDSEHIRVFVGEMSYRARLVA